MTEPDYAFNVRGSKLRPERTLHEVQLIDGGEVAATCGHRFPISSAGLDAPSPDEVDEDVVCGLCFRTR